MLGVQEERKEEEGKGEGGSRMEEERAGTVFLTFRMVSGRATAGVDRRSAWTVTCAHHCRISFTTSRQKKYVFLMKNSNFHLSRTLFLEGPNYMKNIFPHFINITFSSRKTTGSFDSSMDTCTASVCEAPCRQARR